MRKNRRVRATVAIVIAIFGLLAGQLVPWGASAHAAVGDAATLPPVLPAVQQWQPGAGSGFTWTGSGQVVVNAADMSALSGDAQTFASDLGLAMNTSAPPVVSGALSSARPGDIFLSLGSTDTGLGTEGYGLTIAPVLQVGAIAEQGAFWATQTILQLLHQQTSLPPGSVRDWPKYPIRAVLVDDGARSFPMGWWFNQIRDLSYLKVNEITFTVNRGGLTSAQQDQIVAYAAKYHVPVTPLQPMASYMQVVTPPLPSQYTLVDRTGAQVTGSLDLTNPQAVSWALNVTANALPTFAGPAWHIGADEYPDASQHLSDTADFPNLVNYAHQRYGTTGTPEDLYRDFVNQNDNLVRKAGKTMRMWGDDLFPSSAVGLNSDITVEEWADESGGLKPADLAANGNQLINANQSYLYYDEGNPPSATPQRIWEQFDPGTFNGGYTLPGGDSDPHLAGVELAQWNASNEDPGLLERDLQPLDQAFAQRAWGSALPDPTWSQAQPAIAAIGLPPGYAPTPLGGMTTSAANTIVLPDGTISTYRVGGDGNVWGTSQSTPGGPFPLAWTQLTTGGGFTGTPSVIRAADGALAVYVRTTSGNVWGATQNPPGGPFTGWGPLNSGGGTITSDPSVVLTSEGLVAVYVADVDGYVWGTSQSQPYGTFGAWARVSPGSGYVGKPAVIQTSDGLLSIYSRTTGGAVAGTTQLYYQGPFSAWSSLGPPPVSLAGDPTVIVTRSGLVAAYATGTDGAVWGTSQAQRQGPFGPWQQLSPTGGYVGQPAVAQTSDGLISVFARTSGGTVAGSTQQTVGGPYLNWSPVGSAPVSLTGDPTAVLRPDDLISLFVAGADGNTWNTGQSQAHGTFGPWSQT